jgi:hypothetical protein
MMRTLILALCFIATAMSAETRLRGSQETRDLAQTICSLVPTEADWIALVRPATPEAEAAQRANYQACVAKQNGTAGDDGTVKTDETVTRPGCYEPASVSTWKNGPFAANFECRSNQECVDYTGKCYYYYNRSSCTKTIQLKPECDSIIAKPEIEV